MEFCCRLRAVDQLLADEQVTSTGSGGDVLWPLADHLGTIRDIGDLDEGTNSFGIANHRVYDSFGNLISQTNSSASIDFAYTGKYFDPDTGLSYHWNRWFDPGLGKWLTPDPIGFAAGDANLYRYVGNHPTGAIDPSGLDWLFPNEVGETGEVISAPVDGDANAGFFDPVTKFLNPGISQQYFDLAVASASSSTGTGTVFTAAPSQQPQYPQLSARPLTYRDMAIDDTLTPAEQEAYYEAIELEAWRRRDTTGWYGSRAMQIQYFEDRIAIAARIRRYHDMSVAERLFHPDSIFDLNTAIMIVGMPAGPPPIGGFFEPNSPVIVGKPSPERPTFVATPNGRIFRIPEGWVGRTADNGKGIVYQRPGASGNADMIRIMDPTPQYPIGYFRYYNGFGQPLDVHGKPGPNSATHIPLDYQGELQAWPE